MTLQNGGTVDTGTGDSVEASVEVPPGAVGQNTNIQIGSILAANPALPRLPAGILSRVFRLSPAGLRFLLPITLIISYDDSEVVGLEENTLRPILLVDGTWTQVEDCHSTDPPAPDPCLASRDTINNELTITTTHFSIYGVQGAKLLLDR